MLMVEVMITRRKNLSSKRSRFALAVGVGDCVRSSCRSCTYVFDRIVCCYDRQKPLGDVEEFGRKVLDPKITGVLLDSAVSD
ncbi:Cyclic nucleotide-binding domain [Musa troglodytarum]|uniref:Cyclic nucleotide-binding domain n=1 Tax=Musa troglodytarum TaxID=320322 RepID=A0A9E7HZ25_9LILI|nr:Cyclic nucleotide-binding domain [Musa troglodytarum]